MSCICTAALQACEQALHEVLLPAVAAYSEQQASKPVNKQKQDDVDIDGAAKLLSQVPLGFGTGGMWFPVMQQLRAQACASAVIDEMCFYC
jgi:hypothetical protein